MRHSAVNLHTSHITARRWGKARLRYLFTLEDIRLSCGSALLQPSGESTPTVSLTWRSGKKKAFGGVVRGFTEPEGSGARWTRPVSMACSLTSNAKSDRTRFEPRPSEITLRVEGSKASRRRLVGTLDLAAHASYERSTTKLTIPLEHGAGSLQLELSASWMKKSVLDDDEDSEFSERTSHNGENDDHSDDSEDSSLGASRPRAPVSELHGVVEEQSETAEAAPRHSPRGGGVPRHSPSAAAAAATASAGGGTTAVPLSAVPAGGLPSSSAPPTADDAPAISGGLVRSGSFGRTAERLGGVLGGGGHRRTPSYGFSRRGSMPPLTSASPPTTRAEASSGADISVNVSESLIADASSGADISYTGEATVQKKKSVSGSVHKN